MAAYERRFAESFIVPIIPLGAKIEYKPARELDIQRLHAFGKKTHTGIFIGYVQHAGGGWTGDVRVIDWQEVEQAQRRTDIHIKRMKADEVELVQTEKHGASPNREAHLLPCQNRQIGDARGSS